MESELMSHAVNIASFFGLAIAIATVLEGSLSVVFQWKHYVRFLGDKGLKVPISIIVAFTMCNQAGLDFVATLFDGEPSLIGEIIAAGFVSGGSKKIAKKWGDLKGLGKG